MSRVLLINGSPNAKGCTFTALNEIAGVLERNGVEAEIFHLGKKAMQGCIGCFGCGKIGRCVFNDSVNDLNTRAEEFGAIVIGSPVYYGSAAGSLCAFLDRLFMSGGEKWQGKLGACVVSCRRGGATAAFDRLNKYFTINNMPVVSSQYWNQVHGFTPDDVRKDLEGLQTMRTLGENIAWLLKCTDGKPMPEHEPSIMTNFIQ